MESEELKNATEQDFAAPDRTGEFVDFDDADVDHPYLQDQPVGNHGLKQDGKKLLVPICEPGSGQVLGWEEIRAVTENGEIKWEKKTAAGTPKKGNGLLVGWIKDEVILVAEGYRTAASIFECSGYGCYVSFGSANIVPLGKKLRELCPRHRILFCGDNDEVGRKVAAEAAEAVQGNTVFPEFPIRFGKETKDFNDLHYQAGAEEVKHQIEAAVSICVVPPQPEPDPESQEYPWEVLAPGYAACMEDLAASCGSAPEPAAIYGFPILQSLLGRMVVFCPSRSHYVKPIDWFLDIRESGSGKTPILKLLTAPLREIEKSIAKTYKQELAEWKKISPKEQGERPWRRVLVLDGATIESLRDRLVDGHGGLLWSFEEGSAFFTGQGQYKKGGDDRENLQKLFDGNAFNIARVGDVFAIPESAVSIVGGTQPKTLRYCLQKNNDLMMMDGTLFRFQLYYESQSYYPKKEGGWSEKSQQYWEYLVCEIVKWADDRYRNWRTELGNEVPLYIRFDPEAQHFFHVFEEKVLAERFRLDDEGTFQFSNFIPKAITHLISTAGMLHIIKAIDSGVGIDKAGPISKETVVGAAKIILFHLGQAAEFFAEVFSDQKGEGDRSGDRTSTQEVIRRTLLIKAGDRGDRGDRFFQERRKIRKRNKTFNIFCSSNINP